MDDKLKFGYRLFILFLSVMFWDCSAAYYSGKSAAGANSYPASQKQTAAASSFNLDQDVLNFENDWANVAADWAAQPVTPEFAFSDGVDFGSGPVLLDPFALDLEVAWNYSRWGTKPK